MEYPYSDRIEATGNKSSLVCRAGICPACLGGAGEPKYDVTRFMERAWPREPGPAIPCKDRLCLSCKVRLGLLQGGGDHV